MRSNSAVFGNPGDGRSGMEFRAAVHFMETASKVLMCRWLLQVTSDTLSGNKQRSHTGKRTCQDRRKLFVPAVAGREMLGVPYINRN